MRENENWFDIILKSEIQGKGNGNFLIDELKKKNNSLKGWVIDNENEVKQNETFYRSPMLFYIKNGFTICSEIRIEKRKNVRRKNKLDTLNKKINIKIINPKSDIFAFRVCYEIKPKSL